MPSSAWKKRGSEEHTSELQSHDNLVCRLRLEKKRKAGPSDGGCGVRANGGRWWSPPSRTPVRGVAVPVVLPSGRSGRYGAGFFFFNDTATPEISPLPLPAALPF